MGVYFADKEQLAFLLSEIQHFLQAQRASTTDAFYTRIFAAWFTKWKIAPDDPDRTEKYTVMKKKIKNFFQWNSSKEGSKIRVRSTVGINDIVKRHKASAKKTRAPQEIEIYQQKYKIEIAGEVGERKARETLRLDRKLTASERMSIQRRTPLEMYAAESDEVKAAVKAEYQAALQAIERSKVHTAPSTSAGAEEHEAEGDEEEGDDEQQGPTAIEYERALAFFPVVFARELEMWSEVTGWTFFVMACGPKPSAGGSLYMQQFSAGPKSQATGNDFTKTYPMFESHVRVPFATYAAESYTLDDLMGRSLSPEDMVAHNSAMKERREAAKGKSHVPQTSSDTIPIDPALTSITGISTSSDSIPIDPALTGITGSSTSITEAANANVAQLVSVAPKPVAHADSLVHTVNEPEVPTVSMDLGNVVTEPTMPNIGGTQVHAPVLEEPATRVESPANETHSTTPAPANEENRRNNPVVFTPEQCTPSIVLPTIEHIIPAPPTATSHAPEATSAPVGPTTASAVLPQATVTTAQTTPSIVAPGDSGDSASGTETLQDIDFTIERTHGDFLEALGENTPIPANEAMLLAGTAPEKMATPASVSTTAGGTAVKPAPKRGGRKRKAHIVNTETPVDEAQPAGVQRTSKRAKKAPSFRPETVSDGKPAKKKKPSWYIETYVADPDAQDDQGKLPC